MDGNPVLLKYKQALDDKCSVYESSYKEWTTVNGLIWRRKGLVFASLKVFIVFFFSSIFNVTTSKELEMLERIGSKTNSMP